MSKALATRLSILQKAFELVYVNGFQATSIDDIIAQTKVTKGAFFHHFKNKEEMGLAMIKEIMFPAMYEGFVKPMSNSEDPINDIYNMTKFLLLDNPTLLVQYGCPAGNLIQEMSPVNPFFNKILSELTSQWQTALESCIQKGISMGQFRNGVNEKQVALFLISGYWGVRNIGKLYNNQECYISYLQELKKYLGSI